MKIELFKRKREVLGVVNAKLENFGYEVKLKEVIVKWGMDLKK